MPTSTRTKVALVTGASSGIGYELTQQLVTKLNYKVYAAARRVESLEKLQEQYGKDSIVPVRLDVTDEKAILALKQRFSEELVEGKLDLLYNNAGQSCTFPALDVTNANIEQVFKVNVFGPMNLTRELSPFLINSASEEGSVPVIAFTGSLAGIAPFPFGSVYGSSKAAIHQYARTLHLEMKPFGVKVLNVVTGGVNTDIADTRDLPADSVYNFPEGLDAFTYRQKMAKNNKPMDPQVYCAQIINDISGLQSNASNDPVDVYRGSKAFFIKYVMLLVPYFILDLGLIKKFRLIPVFNALAAKKLDQQQASKKKDA